MAVEVHDANEIWRSQLKQKYASSFAQYVTIVSC